MKRFALVVLVACAACASSAPPAIGAADRLNAESVRRLSRGDGAGAEETARAALKEAVLGDDLRGQAKALTNLGALAFARGQLDEAIERFRSAGALHRGLAPVDDGESVALTNLGTVLLAKRDLQGADAAFAKAIARAQARRATAPMAACARRAGRSARRAGAAGKSARARSRARGSAGGCGRASSDVLESGSIGHGPARTRVDRRFRGRARADAHRERARLHNPGTLGRDDPSDGTGTHVATFQLVRIACVRIT